MEDPKPYLGIKEWPRYGTSFESGDICSNEVKALIGVLRSVGLQTSSTHHSDPPVDKIILFVSQQHKPTFNDLLSESEHKDQQSPHSTLRLFVQNLHLHKKCFNNRTLCAKRIRALSDPFYN